MPKRNEAHVFPALPGDFALFNFTDMEEDARYLSQMNDNWVNEPVPQPINCLADGVHGRNQSTIDKWR